jgi:hypothetical protein
MNSNTPAPEPQQPPDDDTIFINGTSLGEPIFYETPLDRWAFAIQRRVLAVRLRGPLDRFSSTLFGYDDGGNKKRKTPLQTIAEEIELHATKYEMVPSPATLRDLMAKAWAGLDRDVKTMYQGFLDEILADVVPDADLAFRRSEAAEAIRFRVFQKEIDSLAEAFIRNGVDAIPRMVERLNEQLQSTTPTIETGSGGLFMVTGENGVRIEVHDAKTFSDSVKAFQYLCPPFVAYGNITGISSPRGEGKTLLVSGLAEALVKNYPTWLGYPIIRRTGRVLLWLTDDPSSMTKKRIDTLKLDAPGFYPIGPDHWDGNPIDALRKLPEIVERLDGVDLIVLDAKYMFLPSGVLGAANDTSITKELNDVLLRVAEKTNAAIWLNDHDNRKGGEMSGSNVTGRGMLTILRLRPPDDGAVNYRVLEITKHRDLARGEWPRLRVRQDEVGRFQTIGADRVLTDDEREQMILGWLRPMPVNPDDPADLRPTSADLAVALKMRKEDMVALLTALKVRNVIDIVKQRPEGGRGRPREGWYLR